MIRNYIKTTSKIKKEITFFLISDLHYFKPKDLKKCQFILEEIHKRKPAYLIIAGDLLDSSNIAHEHFFINFIKACALETTVLIGIGNHDITFIENKRTLYDRNKNFWKQLNKIKNVYVLDNKNFETDEKNRADTLYLIGSSQKFTTGLMLKQLENEQKINMNHGKY